MKRRLPVFEQISSKKAREDEEIDCDSDDASTEEDLEEDAELSEIERDELENHADFICDDDSDEDYAPSTTSESSSSDEDTGKVMKELRKIQEEMRALREKLEKK
jgi:hypothetical protein